VPRKKLRVVRRAGQQRVIWSVPLVLQRENTLAIRLQGKPKGRIGIVVVHD